MYIRSKIAQNDRVIKIRLCTDVLLFGFASLENRCSIVMSKGKMKVKSNFSFELIGSMSL